MAHAAVISLKQTIHRLLNSSHQIPIVSSSQEILEFAHNEVKSLQQVLKRFDSSSSRSGRLNALDEEIREAVHKLEDVLEFHESDHFPPQSESINADEVSSRTLSVDAEEVRKEINSFLVAVKKMEEEFNKELHNPLPEEDDDDAVSSSRIDFGGKMVGLSDDFTKTKNHLLRSMRPDDFGVFSVVGMAGSGRTLAAKKIFHDLYVGKEQSFDCGARVTIRRKYPFKEILLKILAQVDDPTANDKISSEGVEKVAEHLYTCLKGKRYIILLNGIRNTEVWDELKRLFPEQNNGSLVLLTTGLKEVALYANSLYIYEMPLLDEEYSWGLLRGALFGAESCPPELEEAGKKIAKNCRGLGIPLAKVMLFLLESEKTAEYWNKIAADKKNSIFRVADEVSEIHKIEEGMQPYQSLPDNDKRNLTIELILIMLDLSNMARDIKIQMFPTRLFPKMEIMSFLGMTGIGKTTLVKEIFEDHSILHHFDHRVWVTLGPKYKSKDILMDVLAQIYPAVDKMHIKRDAKLAKDLCGQLSYKRCLIVLDDAWDKEPLHNLKQLLPDIKGELLVTTRLAKVAKFGECDRIHEMRLLNNEESWCLLRHKVFGEELCSSELEKAGKKIAENCEGLPLTIITVANLLSKAEKTPEYWKKVAEGENTVFVNAHNEISKALLPGYKSLPQHLKPCFLYMGVFRQNYVIPTSKIIKLWSSEGFLKPNPSQTIKDLVAECLSELVDRSLLMVCQKGSNFKIKTCRLHSVYWHLLNSEAVKNKFFHALNSFADDTIEGIKSQRRLCVRNSILLSIKAVHHSLVTVLTARSLLCTGPPQQYPVPIYFDLRLLRILDALAIRFYEFPIEVVKLIHLRYLALTCHGKLPASISKLWNLQFLIIRRHFSVKLPKDWWYLPVEIWDMQELKHLQIMGNNLVDNPNCGPLLPNLFTLSDVSAYSCTEGVLKRIPNLKKLGIRIELEPHDDGEALQSCLNGISCLHALESLKCVVINPKLRYDFVARPTLGSIFPSSLRKLSLSGLGYPWEFMSIISSLPKLEVLKLRCYAFRGPEWETSFFDFLELKFLMIEDTDLVRWKTTIPSFPKLECLIFKHCYKLEELPRYFSESVEMIEVIDCNPFAVTWAKQMDGGYLSSLMRLETVKVLVHSSWDTANLKQ